MDLGYIGLTASVEFVGGGSRGLTALQDLQFRAQAYYTLTWHLSQNLMVARPIAKIVTVVAAKTFMSLLLFMSKISAVSSRSAEQESRTRFPAFRL